MKTWWPGRHHLLAVRPAVGNEQHPYYQAAYKDRINQEVAQTPDEYLPLLLEMIHLFRQSIALKPAEELFRQG